MELSSPKLKKLLYFFQKNFPLIFKEGIFKAQKAKNFLYHFKKVLPTFQDDC